METDDTVMASPGQSSSLKTPETQKLTKRDVDEMTEDASEKVIAWMIEKGENPDQTRGTYNARGGYELRSLERSDAYNLRIIKAVNDYAIENFLPGRADSVHADFVREEWYAPSKWAKYILKDLQLTFFDKDELTLLKSQIQEVVIGACINYIISKHGVNPFTNIPFGIVVENLYEIYDLLQNGRELDQTHIKFLIDCNRLELLKTITDPEMTTRNKLLSIELELKHMFRFSGTRMFTDNTHKAIAVRVVPGSPVTYPTGGFLSSAGLLRDSMDSPDGRSRRFTVPETLSRAKYTSRSDIVNGILNGIDGNSINPDDCPQGVELPFLGNGARFELMPGLEEAATKYKHKMGSRGSRSKKQRTARRSSSDDMPLFGAISRSLNGNTTNILAHSALVIMWMKLCMFLDIEYGKEIASDPGSKHAVLVFNSAHIDPDQYNEIQNVGIVSSHMAEMLDWFVSLAVSSTAEAYDGRIILRLHLNPDVIAYRQKPKQRIMYGSDGLPVTTLGERIYVNCASLLEMCGAVQRQRSKPYPWPGWVARCDVEKIEQFFRNVIDAETPNYEGFGGSGTRKRNALIKKRKTRKLRSLSIV